MKNIVIVVSLSIMFGGCTLFSAKQFPEGSSQVVNFNDPETCNSTKVMPTFSGEHSEVWEERVLSSAKTVTEILQTQSFSQACQALRMTRTNDKSVQEVCREMVCAGEIIPSISFYHDPSTRAIAYESNGALLINTAKESAGAGGPGNIAHEVTHTLGYTHFTNWAFLGKSSVPYRIGNLVQKLSNEN